MKLTRILAVPVRTGSFADDQAAMRIGARPDGFTYAGAPVTPGFTAVRPAGEAVSVLFVLDDGFVAQGDCAAVQYSAAGGRDVLFRAEAGQQAIARLRPRRDGVRCRPGPRRAGNGRRRGPDARQQRDGAGHGAGADPDPAVSAPVLSGGTGKM